MTSATALLLCTCLVLVVAVVLLGRRVVLLRHELTEQLADEGVEATVRTVRIIGPDDP